MKRGRIGKEEINTPKPDKKRRKMEDKTNALTEGKSKVMKKKTHLKRFPKGMRTRESRIKSESMEKPESQFGRYSNSSCYVPIDNIVSGDILKHKDDFMIVPINCVSTTAPTELTRRIFEKYSEVDPYAKRLSDQKKSGSKFNPRGTPGTVVYHDRLGLILVYTQRYSGDGKGKSSDTQEMRFNWFMKCISQITKRFEGEGRKVKFAIQSKFNYGDNAISDSWYSRYNYWFWNNTPNVEFMMYT